MTRKLKSAQLGRKEELVEPGLGIDQQIAFWAKLLVRPLA